MDELIPVIAIGINQLPNNMRKFYSNPSACNKTASKIMKNTSP